MATIIVDTDDLDGRIIDGDISLRDALTLASDGGTIRLERGLGALIIEGDVTIDGDLSDDGTPDVTLDGHHDLVITGGFPSYEYFRGSIYISGGATAEVSNSSISANSYGGIGNLGTLMVANSIIDENAASYSGYGEGVHNGGSATLIDTTVSDNLGGRNGVGRIVNHGNWYLLGWTIASNGSRDATGGLSNSGIAELSDSIISENYSALLKPLTTDKVSVGGQPFYGPDRPLVARKVKFDLDA